MLQHIFCSEGLDDTGLLLEFGVYTGSSINLISEHHPTRPVYGFVSFEGLPENRTVTAIVDRYGAGIKDVMFEIRTLDGENLVEQTAVTEVQEESDGRMRLSFSIKDVRN